MYSIPNTPNIIQAPLPNSSAALVLGILSLVSLCCCSFIGLVLAIIGVTLGNRAESMYYQLPGVYSEASYKNANAGKICSIIGLVLNAISVLMIVMFWSTYRAFVMGFMDLYSY